MYKEFMKTVYSSTKYLPFEFLLNYSGIIDKWNGMPVICNGYSIFCKSHEYNNFYKKFLLSTHETPILSKHHLCVAKWNDASFTSNEVIDLFRTDLLKNMLLWMKCYVSMLSDHFKSRSSENRSLNNHNSIRIQLGFLISQISHTEEMIKVPLLFQVSSDSIIKIGMDLHKTAGGRSFLKGNISEMICLFEIIKKIYFSEDIL